MGPLTVWRHPRPRGGQGCCIGGTDLAVDARKAKRLAHRVRQRVRREKGPRVVVTSSLVRGAAVGRWLARWGFEHHVDERLRELDFGRWDGCFWGDIDAAEIAAWTDDFADHAPGGGESVRELMARCRAFLDEPGTQPRYAIGHAGWISAARWVSAGHTQPLTAAEWPEPVRYAEAVSFFSSSRGAESQ